MRSSYGSRYTTWIRVVILYHFMASTPPTAFVCGYPRQHRLLDSTLICQASALVSPWINNGNALTYVKNHDRLVNYKNLVRLLFRDFSRQSLIVPIDRRHCARDQSPPFDGSSHYSRKFESSGCLLFMTLTYERVLTSFQGKNTHRRRWPTANHGLCACQGSLLECISHIYC